MIALYVALGVLGGMIFLACLALGWYLLKEIIALRKLVEGLRLTEIGTLGAWMAELTAATKLLVQQNAAMTGALEVLGVNTTPPAASPAVEEAAQITEQVRRRKTQPVPLSEEDDDETNSAGSSEAVY